jgi:pyruvate,water dikinase
MTSSPAQERPALGERLRRLLGKGANQAQRDPAALFAAFQAVLAGNNRALEAITDLGDKLGGDYLFDVNYTRRAYAELYTAISTALANFTDLTGDAYPGLGEVLTRIDHRVRRMLDDSGPEGGPLVVAYPEITWDLAEAVGGKNYHLAALGNELRLRIPAAFAVTTSAFTLFCEHNQLHDRIRQLASAADPEPALTALQQAIRAGNLPEAFNAELARAIRQLTGRQGQLRLAVRSSGEEEDGDFSFAGQFESRLNVPAEPGAVAEAWKEVAASLFSKRAIAYQRAHGYEPGRLKMAVACVAMVVARASGVIFTVAGPGQSEDLTISAAWGLGPAVVDGITDADLYTVRKGEMPVVESIRLGRKELMVVASDTPEGIATVATPEAERGRQCLSESQILELAGQAQQIEQHFQGPQDIEWALDQSGKIYILQSRGLRIDDEEIASPAATTAPELPVLLRDQGVVVKRGTTAGRVFVVRESADLERVPRGAILVAHHDSPQFVRVIPFIHAIITDTGSPTSHLASICREFALPAVVNTTSATTSLPEGREVTLQAGDGGYTVYEGVARELLREGHRQAGQLRELYEFRRQKYLMRYIAPLHLINPLEEEFAPEKCRSVHDLIRFMHEKAVQALVAGASRQTAGLTARLLGRASTVRQLALPIPIRMLLLDLGGAVANGSGRELTPAELSCRPLQAILAGMLAPGVWREEAQPLTGRDFLAGMTRAADPGTLDAAAGANLAVGSAEYVNLSLRFGYHFNMLDAYCTENPRNNHIFFRFVGGAAALTSRSLRIHFMAKVMASLGFMTKPKGDLLVARISNIPAEEVERLLTTLGRLIGFARQLDAAITSEEAAERLAGEFLAGL